VRGLRLAGVSGQVVASAPEAAKAIESVAAQPDCAVIILSEPVAELIRPLVDRVRLEWQRPLIVEIPGPQGPLPGRKPLNRLAQESLGIRVEAKGI